MTVSDTEGRDVLICPLCGKRLRTSRSFVTHVSLTNDGPHRVLCDLKKKYSGGGFLNYLKAYQDNRDFFQSFLNDNHPDDESWKDLYMNIPCTCKITCRLCFEHWKTDFFDHCNHARKKGYLRQYHPDDNVLGNENVESVEGTEGETNSSESPLDLVKYFYVKTQFRSPNWGRDVKLIKHFMFRKNNPMTSDQIKVVLDYMARKSLVDLRAFRRCVNEALLEHRYLQEANQEGTAAYLVRYFYEGHKMKINMQTFVRDVNKIQETMNSGLSYDETKTVIDYMIKIKCTVLPFIGSKRNEALGRMKSKNDLRSNPSFFDQDYMTILRDELIGGRINLTRVEPRHREAAVRMANELFRERKFANRYTAFEWAWRVGLELTRETYEMACRDSNPETYFDRVLKSGKVDEVQAERIRKLKAVYETWLRKQHATFGDPARTYP